jgi:hypothetical protein
VLRIHVTIDAEGTMESQRAQLDRHEYRMKVSKSGLYLLSAVLFIVASLPVASRGLASTSAPMALDGCGRCEAHIHHVCLAATTLIRMEMVSAVGIDPTTY